MSPQDIHAQPQAFLARSWECVIGPGDVLVIPPRTLHAVENLTPVMSYSRFHVTSEDLGEWLRSFVAFDSPSIPHERIMHEAALHFIQRTDAMVEEDLHCIKHLRDACRVLASRVNAADEDKFLIWISCASELDAKLPEYEQRPAITSRPASTRAIVVGDAVSLRPNVVGGRRKGKRAIVVGVDKHILLGKVFFPEFNTVELVPLRRIRVFPKEGGNLAERALGKNARVEVMWTTGEAFQGVFQSELPIEPVDGLEIQFHTLGTEWNQWITMEDVSQVTRGFRVEL